MLLKEQHGLEAGSHVCTYNEKEKKHVNGGGVHRVYDYPLGQQFGLYASMCYIHNVKGVCKHRAACVLHVADVCVCMHVIFVSPSLCLCASAIHIHLSPCSSNLRSQLGALVIIQMLPFCSDIRRVRLADMKQPHLR